MVLKLNNSLLQFFFVMESYSMFELSSEQLNQQNHIYWVFNFTVMLRSCYEAIMLCETAVSKHLSNQNTSICTALIKKGKIIKKVHIAFNYK